MDRAKKHSSVSDMNSRFKEAEIIVVAGYMGISVAGMSELRTKARSAGGSVKVAKKSLLRLALKDTKFEKAFDLMDRETVVIFSKDPVVAPQVSMAFAKENDKFSVFGGVTGDGAVFDRSGIKVLADLPSIGELRAKLAGVIKQPMVNIARCLLEPGSSLVRLIKQKTT